MKARKPNLLITVQHFVDPELEPARKMLEDYGFNIRYNEVGRDYTFDDLRNFIGEIDAIIAQGDLWTDEIFEAAKNLKILARFGIGYDRVDCESARRHGVDVTVTRVDGLSRSVAELSLGLMLCWARDVANQAELVSRGGWDGPKGTQITGKTISLIGFGKIGQHLAQLLQSFGVTLLAYDTCPNEEKAKELHVTFVSLEEALARGDYVSLHVPNLKETRHMINERTLGLMKPTACLVNTSRGALVDEKALVQALNQGTIAGAVLDVFEQEPTAPDNPLREMKNVIAVPHVGGSTSESFVEMAISTAQSVIDRLENRPLASLVN